MDKAKINYYLLAIFIVLLVANIYFYFFKDRDKLVLADPQCPGFNNCAGANNCDGGGGGGGNFELTDFRVQTFLCNTNPSDWDDPNQPWLEARNDGKPNINNPAPPTTSQAAPDHQTCNVTNAGEPINVIVRASSSQPSTLWVRFNDPSGTTRYTTSTSKDTFSSTDEFKVPFSPPSKIGNRWVLGSWIVETYICPGTGNSGQNGFEGGCEGLNDSNSPATSSVKVYLYDCYAGMCKAGIPSPYDPTKLGTLDLGNERNKWCAFWADRVCGLK